jgi:lipopolysaccharide/colanic/teichoic acid biosynthesis glycosyltransferase
MRIWPVILDSKPNYLHERDRRASLLTAPLGFQSVLEYLMKALAPITENPPIIIAPDPTDQDYDTWIREISPSALVVRRSAAFAAALAKAELSDALLYLDPRWTAVDASQLTQLVRQHLTEPRVSHHLVAFEKAIAGTKERVCFDETGAVRGVQRHYEPATWPFISGVAATLVPCACDLATDGLMPRSILELRHLLFDRGVPTQDVPLSGKVLDLGDERGLLAANEQLLLEVVDRTEAGVSAPFLLGEGHVIHPGARLLGPVIIHSGARVDADATILGPAIIGAGARIGAGAIVAHAVIGPASIVPPKLVIRDRAWFRSSGDHAFGSGERPPVSYSERLARVSMDLLPSDALRDDTFRARRAAYQSVKRALDVTVALIGLALLAPLFIVVAAAIWLESRGPVFYGDKREGRDGQRFKCWKFRTMFTGAHLAQRTLKGLDHTDGPHFKIDRDPRVTRMGGVLRALNLDEVPQLLNVLSGEMSLVGPRPSPFRENQVCVPWRTARLSVRPGITGFWQICRHNRSAGDFHQWIEYDLLYVQHLSLMLDLKIVAGTLLTLGGKLAHIPSSWLVVNPLAPPDVVPIDRPARQHESEQVA